MAEGLIIGKDVSVEETPYRLHLFVFMSGTRKEEVNNTNIKHEVIIDGGGGSDGDGNESPKFGRREVLSEAAASTMAYMSPTSDESLAATYPLC